MSYILIEADEYRTHQEVQRYNKAKLWITVIRLNKTLWNVDRQPAARGPHVSLAYFYAVCHMIWELACTKRQKFFVTGENTDKIMHCSVVQVT
jgi:hypothetical protein